MNNENERGLLAACIMDPSVISTLDVHASDFVDVAHAELWKLLTRLQSDGIDLRDKHRLLSELRISGVLGRFGGVGGFNENYLRGMGPTARNAAQYARDVRAASAKRELTDTLVDLLNQSKTTTAATQLAEVARQRLSDIAASSSSASTCMTFHEAAKQKFDQLNNPDQSPLGRQTPSGLCCLDNQYRGLRAGALYVVAGRPGDGKSALVKQIASSFDVRGMAALFVSLEMEPAEIAERVLSERAGIDGDSFQIGEFGAHGLTMMEMQSVKKVINDSANSKLFISAPKGRDATLEAITAHARMMHAKHGLRLLAVDYLQIMSRSQRGQSDYDLATTNSKAFKQLARELNIPIILLSQLNRSNQKDSAKPRRPRLSDLRDSGAIEQDADGVILLHRCEENKPDFELIVGKWRNGQPSMAKVWLDGAQTRFLTKLEDE
jgi:replicative DNA helicase